MGGAQLIFFRFYILLHDLLLNASLSIGAVVNLAKTSLHSSVLICVTFRLHVFM